MTEKPVQEANFNILHLQAELARLDILIRHEIRRWQTAGQDSKDSFRGLYVSDQEAEALLDRPLATNWGQTVQLDPEETGTFTQALAKAIQEIQAIGEAGREANEILRLEYLAHAFSLDRFDIDTLLICLAPSLDLRYERFYGYLQDDVTRKRPTVNLVLDLLGEPGPGRLALLHRFGNNTPLFKYRLLEKHGEAGAPLLSHTLQVDEALVRWLLGGFRPHTDLELHTKLFRPEKANPADELLAGKRVPAWEDAAGDQPITIFYGPDQSSQAAAARTLAAKLGRALLATDLTAVVAAKIPQQRAVRLALRDARLTAAVPHLVGWDICLDEKGSGAPPAELLAELCDHPGPVVVSGKKNWQPKGLDRERPFFWAEFPLPDTPQRLALWQHFLKIDDTSTLNIAGLAGQFILTTGQIRDAAATARDAAVQRGETLQSTDLFAAARVHSNPRLSSLAHKIVPRFDWDDIVLPADQLTLLKEIVNMVRGRPLVLEQWGVGQKLASSAGVTVLFSGDPGTGKTMAAEVMAAELELDLYKIDLSTVVSKYIGETEKNLERIFGEAQSSNAILFFDEADAIFGKRSEVRDAHDRYANIETSYLLQRMEAYDGVTILATNLRANLDDAFTRRLHFVVDFPFPEEKDRLRIWQALSPPGVPQDDDLDFALLARRFRIAGGNIRNILVGAAYLAANNGKQMTMGHLFHATRRELQKMGRLINEQDLTLD